ncbi:MAG: lytic murein transglycosylase B [Pseudomonadota bacterium]
MTKKIISRVFIALSLLLLIMSNTAYAIFVPATQRQDVQTFINTMVKEHQFNHQELESLFSRIMIYPLPKRTKKNEPLEAKPWYMYRDLYVTPKRIANGVKFWQQNAAALSRAEKQYGVPASIIVAILGAETNYGKTPGDKPVLNTLANIAFSDSHRAKYFRSELAQFLLLCREQDFDPLEVKGSYAGAIGQPQFMPSSYRTYAVKFAGNKNADLIHNSVDAIGSIANFLKHRHWQANQAVAVRATIKHQAGESANLPKPTFRLTYTGAELKKYDITTAQPIDDNAKARFIALQDKNGMEYWIGLNNFYVITRYNESTDYAMAVYQLSQAISKRYHAIEAKSV